jgi:hypothetical protein
MVTCSSIRRLSARLWKTSSLILSDALLNRYPRNRVGEHIGTKPTVTSRITASSGATPQAVTIVHVDWNGTVRVIASTRP